MARTDLLKAVAATIRDYRAGEIPSLDEDHVEQWVSQFPQGAQEGILSEVSHVLSKSYITRENVLKFLNTVLTSKKFVGESPCEFWKGVRFLHLQTAGNSQREMLSIFSEMLKKICGLSVEDCGVEPHTFLYLDDAIFSGGRVKNDIIRWIRDECPAKANVAVVMIGLHQLGAYFAGKDIAAAARDVGKEVSLTWWRAIAFEDRKAYMANSDVLRPTAIPGDAATQAYVASLGAEPVLRVPGQLGELKLFSSDAGRALLEQEFLTAGVGIRGACPYLNAYMRPLGNTTMKTTGFGAMMVTFRNCPNNAPLVFWAGNPWYPLFPRKTN